MERKLNGKEHTSAVFIYKTVKETMNHITKCGHLPTNAMWKTKAGLYIVKLAQLGGQLNRVKIQYTVQHKHDHFEISVRIQQ